MEEKRAWKVGEAGRTFLPLSRKPMPVPSQRAPPRVRPGSSRPGALVPGRVSTLRGGSPQCRLLPRKVPQPLASTQCPKVLKTLRSRLLLGILAVTQPPREKFKMTEQAPCFLPKAQQKEEDPNARAVSAPDRTIWGQWSSLPGSQCQWRR